jgi:hypothetical protein
MAYINTYRHPPPPSSRTPHPCGCQCRARVQYPPPLRLVVDGNASSREGCNDAISRLFMPKWCAHKPHLVGVVGSRMPIGETLGSALGHGSRLMSG